MSIVIWWIRRDLRLVDNQALRSAMLATQQVIPVFILDPFLLDSSYMSEKRKAFLMEGLVVLSKELEDVGSRLIVRQGAPSVVLARLLTECRAEKIFAEPDYSLYARRRDSKVSKILPVQFVGSPAYRLPESVLKADSTPYTVFTPFSKIWKALPLQGDPESETPIVISTPADLDVLPIPFTRRDKEQIELFPAGQRKALERLKRFTQGGDALIYSYGKDRNFLDLDGTSALSPYLRFGMLSARQAVQAAYQAIWAAPSLSARQSAEAWLNELIWRDFYLHILYHFPFVSHQSFRTELRGIRWLNSPEDFQSWCEGRTGYPVVDAAMHQLVQTGWMHNRARMIVASFLTKDLLVDWRWGERFFMQHLIDGDPAANNGGWQWAAGVGTDAAPYFRVFNPVLQGKKFDPQGHYIRKWVTELANLPAKTTHEPWLLTHEKTDKPELQSGRGIPGKEYPAPIVDHSMARKRVLDVYGEAKGKS